MYNRLKLVKHHEKLHIYSGASCIGQGLGTVLVQMVVTNTDLKHEDIVYERSNTWISPDSGTTSGRHWSPEKPAAEHAKN